MKATDTVQLIPLDGHLWSDERGWGVNPLDPARLAGEVPGDFHVVSMNPGSVRGNHVHALEEEWLLVLSGPARIVWKQMKSMSHETIDIPPEGPHLLRIPKNVPHAIQNTGSGEIFLVAFGRHADRGTQPCRVIETG